MGLSDFEILYNRNEDSIAVSDVRLSIILGFGLHQTWTFSLFFGAEKTFVGTPSEFEFFFGLYFTASLITLACTFLTCALLDRRIENTITSPRTTMVAAPLCASATLLLISTQLPEAISIVCALTGGILSGLASSILVLQWGVVFGKLDVPSATINSTIGFALGIVTCALFICQLPVPVSTALTATLPLIEGYFLGKTLGRKSRTDDLPKCELHLPVRASSLARVICVPMALFGVACGLFEQSSLRMLFVVNSQTDAAIVLAGASLAVVIVIACVFTSRSHQLNFLYRPLLPVVAIGLLLTPSLLYNLLPVNLVLLFAYLCFRVLMWVTTCEWSSRYRISPLLTFGLSRGSLAMGTLLVDIFQRFHTLSSFGQPPQLIDAGIAAAALACVTVAYALLPRESTLKTLVFNSTPASIDLAKPNISPDTIEQGETEAEGFSGRFMRRCQQVADEYLLTRKETEVFFMLAKGRNATYIQEQLVVSENTVRTHMRHIYRKLGIHSQQELIDLVESKKSISYG